MPQRHLKDPEKLELVVPGNSPWGGLNRYDGPSKYTIADNEADDLINWVPMGNSYRQILGISAPIATLAATAIWLSAQILNGGIYIFALCTDNNCYQVAIPGGAITKINGATALSASTDITNWQGTTIILTDPQTGGGTIYSWTGSVFASVFTNQPANYITVYQGRLFGAINSTVWFTDANTFNSLGGSAGSFKITDAPSTQPILALVSFQGSLLIFGSNFIQILSNMYVFGSPPVATFNLYQLESQIGCVNRFSIIPMGSTLYFANSYGIWAMNGSVPQMVSQNIDGLFGNLTANSSFSAAYTTLYSVPCLFWNVQYTGDGAGVYTNLGLASNFQWFRTIQGTGSGTLTFITSTISAGNPTCWGTDGTKIFSLYTNTGAVVSSTYNSKFWNLGQPLWTKLLQKIGFAMVVTSPATGTLTVYSQTGQVLPVTNTSPAFSSIIQFVNNMGGNIQFVNNTPANINFAGQTTTYSIWQYNVEGRVQSFGVSFVVNSISAFFQAVLIQTEWSQTVWGV